MSFTVHTGSEYRKCRDGADGIYYAIYAMKKSLIVRLFFGQRVSRTVLRMGDAGGYALLLIGEGEDAGRIRITPCAQGAPGARRLSLKSASRKAGMQMSFRVYGTPFPERPTTHVDIDYSVLPDGGIEFAIPRGDPRAEAE